MSTLPSGMDVSSVESHAEIRDLLWAEVVGQADVVAALRAAAGDPVHAYMLIGPEGVGKRAAAVAFTAELLSRGLAGQDARDVVARVAAGSHPSVHLVEREGASITAETARRIVAAASLAPPEGTVQVFILDEFHLVTDAGPIMLKAIEEPQPGTTFVVLAEEVTEGLVTIASRCVQMNLSPVPAEEIASRLRAEGSDGDTPAEAARGAGGSLRRARLLAGDPELVRRRALWEGAPGRLDGSGASVSEVGDELMGSIDAVLEPLKAVHEAEADAFDATVDLTGDPARGLRKAMEDRHKRELRRMRSAELVSGAEAMLAGYRSAATRGDHGAATELTAACAAVGAFTEAIRWNANEALALRAMLLELSERSDGTAR